MADFPFDGQDLEPTPAQARLIEDTRLMLERGGVPEPDVIQPRPTNPEAIELFWIDSKLCVVIESDEHLQTVFGPPRRAEAA